jgi:anti-anti-sigma regulatory factor
MISRIREIKDVTIFDLNEQFCRPAGASTTLHESIKSELEKGKRKFLLNFQNVKLIDSFGVGQILASYVSIHKLGGQLKSACLPREMLKTYYSVPHDFWPVKIYENEKAALEGFEKP